MQFLLAHVPMFFVMALLILLESARNPAKSDWRVNLQAWLLIVVVALHIQPLFQIAGIPSLIDGGSLPFWIAFPIFLLVSDFGEFLYHRAQHKVPFLWAMHSLHHSDPEMSVLTTHRHFWGDQLIKTVTIWAAATLIISPTPAMAGAFGLAMLWNFFAHARLPVDLGRWSWVINTPAYHRRHHSRLPEHFDTNFAGLFPIFDVVFGSYRRPDGFPPTGLDQAPKHAWDLIAWPFRQAKRADASAMPATGDRRPARPQSNLTSSSPPFDTLRINFRLKAGRRGPISRVRFWRQGSEMGSRLRGNDEGGGSAT